MSGRNYINHGRRHRPGGSDPISSDYLHWGYNHDDNGVGLTLDSPGGGFETDTHGGGYIIDTTTDEVGDADDFASGGTLQLYTAELQVNSHGNAIAIKTHDGTFEVDTEAGSLDIAAGNSKQCELKMDVADSGDGIGTTDLWGDTVNIHATGDTPDGVLLLAGKSIVMSVSDVGGAFRVDDHQELPLFRVDENGDLHGKTGKSLVFDL